jgi:hypothetical protein
LCATCPVTLFSNTLYVLPFTWETNFLIHTKQETKLYFRVF